MSPISSGSMKPCIALLRGVNVGGRIVPMARLREALAALECEQVRTHIQSGNVVFNARVTAEFAATIESHLSAEFGFPIAVILRTAREWEKVIAGNPFLRSPDVAPARLHVTFLTKPAPAAGLRALEAIDVGDDRFQAVGKEIYLDCPNGYGRTKLSNHVIERKLGLAATTRNWSTVVKLHALASE